MKQPTPAHTSLSTPVLEPFLDFVTSRIREGETTYGTRLHTHNGRDALLDALEEAVDLSLYLMQVYMEREVSKWQSPLPSHKTP